MSDSLIVFVTTYSPYLGFGLIILMKNKKLFLLTSCSLLLSFASIYLIHLFIQIPRPFLVLHTTPLIPPPNSYSFPSGHSATMAVYASALLLIKSKWAIFFLLWALLVGYSRIYVRVHYPIDVLGGLVLGFIITFMILKFSQIWRRS